MPNQLVESTSPYLLQHAHNPVDWYPWGAPALEESRRSDKPIFLSIGYAACHWCHVMAHESFEDPETAAILNRHFVNIKVDREERPDLDNLYMAAVVALTGQGGWPMSVFLTPDLQPFYGGTYFPPAPRHGLPAFRELLLALAEAWQGRREEILAAGQRLAAHLREQAGGMETGEAFTPENLKTAAEALVQAYDWHSGGWGDAPKFPQPMAIEFLLRRGAIEPALHALRAMSRGGMYDVVGGGFSRYSTDAAWHVPHFEKMLYDNALLSRAYLHAWQASADPAFRRVAQETLDFVAREMLSPEGGFYSSLDADSEGEEGRFYAWTLEQLRAALGADSEFFETAYGVTARGNWEGRTVLQRALDDTTLAARFELTREQVADKLAGCHRSLLTVRATRPRPGTDDKVLAAWNGLMLSAFARAGAALGRPDYLGIAARNADFLLSALRPDGRLRRSWRDGQAGAEVFLEDYAALILGLLDLYQADFDPRWYKHAETLATEMLARFEDPEGGFFDTPVEAEPPLLRPKDLQDNATPSGNALAAEALLELAAFSGDAGWRARAEAALSLVSAAAVRYPTAFGRWLGAADFAASEVQQVAIVGDPADERTQALLAEVRRGCRPNLIVAAAPHPVPPGVPALLDDRPPVDGQPAAYVCEGFVCQRPVTGAVELRALLDRGADL